MEGKILGITLSVIGFFGLLLAVFYMNAVEDSKEVNVLLGCGFFGAAVFFTGIWLLPARQAANKVARAARMDEKRIK